MEDWIESTLDEIAFVNPRESMPKGSLGKKIAMEDVQPFKKFVPSFSIDKYSGE